MLKKYSYYIGIDPGTTTGIAVYDSIKKYFVSVESMMIHEAMDKVNEWNNCYPGQIYIVVEDATQVRFATDAAKAQGAGSVKRDSNIWKDYLTDKKIPFEMVRPKKQFTKMDAKIFERVTGWKQSTNNHGRDAGMLVYQL